MTDSGLFSGFHWTEGLSPRECTVTEIAELVESTKWAHKLSGKEVTTLSRYLCVCEAEKGAVIVREVQALDEAGTEDDIATGAGPVELCP